MASGWTTSGIDWTSVTTMRNSRTEDVLRELYLAVNERNYYIYKSQFFDNADEGGALPALDSSGRLRLKQASKYIQDTVKGWLEPQANHINIITLGSRVPLGSVSCYIDETFTPSSASPHSSLRNEYLWGFINLDYTLGGNFETQFSIDLSLLRTPPERINLNWCKMIYDILQPRLKVTTDLWNASYFAGFGFLYRCDPAYLFNDIDANVENCFYIREKNEGQDAVFNDVVTEVNSNANLSLQSVDFNESSLRYQASTATSLEIGTERHYKSFKISGYSQLLDIKDLDYISISLGYYINDPLSIMPYSNMSFSSIRDLIKIENLTQARINTASTVETLKPGDYLVFDDALSVFDFLDIATTPSGVSEQILKNNVFINLNKEGFIKYYTAP
tara:strand:+ start:294 stop:1463 length:1170 start_codon:yes stop_codon:yes gene_type:complete